MLSHQAEVTNHGKSEVHLTGYQTTTDVMDPEADLESDDEDELELGQSLVSHLPQPSCLGGFASSSIPHS